MGALKSLGIHFDSKAREELREIFRRELAPCEGGTLKGRWSNFWHGWWHDNGPRMPKWDLQVIAYNQDATPGSDEEYEELFTIWQVGYFTVRRFERIHEYTDRPLITLRTYSWD